MSETIFSPFETVSYERPTSENLLAYQWYDQNHIVLGKPLKVGDIAKREHTGADVSGERSLYLKRPIMIRDIVGISISVRGGGNRQCAKKSKK